MRCDWKVCTLSDLGEIVGGATPSTKNSENYGGNISWITPKDLSNFPGRFISRGGRNITEAGLRNCSARLMPKNTILFSSRAPIGYVAIAANELCTNQGFKSIIPNDDTDFMFLYYLLKYNKNAIERLSNGTTFKEVSGSVMKNITVCVPKSKKEQEKIAAILSSLDDKIELNRRINANLEEQAQAIWDSWFINFELFGGIMPDDWKYAILGDVTENLRERVRENKYPVFSAVSSGGLVLSDDFFSKRVYSKNISGYIVVNENNFAYNPARINIGSIGINDFSYKGCVSPVYVVIKVPEEYEGYFYFYFKSKRFRAESSLRASGTVRQTLNYSDFALIEMIYPSREYAEKFNRIYKTVSNAKKAYENETQRLIEIRDSLLPKLISGEIIP